MQLYKYTICSNSRWEIEEAYLYSFTKIPTAEFETIVKKALEIDGGSGYFRTVADTVAKLDTRFFFIEDVSENVCCATVDTPEHKCNYECDDTGVSCGKCDTKLLNMFEPKS